MKKDKKIEQWAGPLAVIATAAAVLSIFGIGCPIKFLTGVSCPGCGMTRAWICALTGRPALALAYHPLFWLLPLVGLLMLARDHMSQRLFHTLLIAATAALIIVWLLRLAIPQNSDVLFSGMLREDVVSVGPPRWLVWVQDALATRNG